MTKPETTTEYHERTGDSTAGCHHVDWGAL